MPTTEKITEPLAEGQGYLHFMVDMPGFALTRDPANGKVEYSWTPSSVPADFVEGLLSTLGLQVDTMWGNPERVLFASLVNREELDQLDA